MPCQVGADKPPMSRLLGGWQAAVLFVAAQLPTSELASERVGQTTTVDGIIIFKSCMGCIFSALSSASRPAVSRRKRERECVDCRDGTAGQF